MTDQMRDLLTVFAFIFILWVVLGVEAGRRQRKLAEELNQIFLGTLRRDAPGVTSRTFQYLRLQVSASDVALRRFLRERVKSGLLRRIPDPAKRRGADRYELTPEGERAMRSLTDA